MPVDATAGGSRNRPDRFEQDVRGDSAQHQAIDHRADGLRTGVAERASASGGWLRCTAASAITSASESVAMCAASDSSAAPVSHARRPPSDQKVAGQAEGPPRAPLSRARAVCDRVLQPIALTSDRDSVDGPGDLDRNHVNPPRPAVPVAPTVRSTTFDGPRTPGRLRRRADLHQRDCWTSERRNSPVRAD